MSPSASPYLGTCTSSNVVYYDDYYWPLISTTWNVTYTTGSDSAGIYIPLYPQTIAPQYPPQAVLDAAIPEQAQAAVNDEMAAARRMVTLVRDHEARRAAADDKARQLLARMLSKEQRARYEISREFEILTRRNGEIRRYLIREGHAGNIVRLDAGGTAIERYCIHTDESIPAADNVVAQKLLLEADEETFLKIANRSVRGAAGLWTPAPRAA